MEETERCRASHWVGHGACTIIVIVLWWRNLKERQCWEDFYIDGRIILKWMGWHEWDSSGSGKCEVASSCEPGFLTKGSEFLN